MAPEACGRACAVPLMELGRALVECGERCAEIWGIQQLSKANETGNVSSYKVLKQKWLWRRILQGWWN